MKKQKNDLNEAVTALKNEAVPAGPPQETIDAILQKLSQVEPVTIKRRIKITEKIKTMKPFTKLAAATAIVIAICLFFTLRNQNGEMKKHQIARKAKLPAELTTFASLSFAYRQGGMEMVEKMCDNALKQAGQRPANISMQEFSEEINNGKSERTKL